MGNRVGRHGSFLTLQMIAARENVSELFPKPNTQHLPPPVKGALTVQIALFEAYPGMWYTVSVKSLGHHVSEVAVGPAELIPLAPNYRLSYLNYFMTFSDRCYRGE